MKNWEKYEKEIRETEGHFAIKKESGEIGTCSCLDCTNCKFFEGFPNCHINRVNWLYEDCTPQPKLTKRERMFCELAGKGYIARDENDVVDFYAEKPKKETGYWIGRSLLNVRNWLNLQFDFIKWEDNEPWSIEDLLKLEVE